MSRTRFRGAHAPPPCGRAPWRRLLHAVLVVVPLWARTAASAQTVSFSQLDFDLDGALYANTEWGSVDLTYTGMSPILYFNLVVNGSWQVQNIPLLSHNGTGVTHIHTFAFDLGVPRGTDVSSIDYAASITPAVLAAPPVGSTFAPLQDLLYAMNSGAIEVPVVPPLPPAGALVGGAAAGAAKHAHANFPNQEAGKDECTPVAVSNSLKFLGFNVSIADAKTATNWGVKGPAQGGPASSPTGAWIGHNDARPAGQRNAWWEDKAAYLAANKIPVVTKRIGSLADVAAEIDHGEDVELQGDWHTASIVGITPLAGGKFSVDVAHDTKQGEAGGTKVETLVYDPATGKFKGSPGFFDGSTFRYAISESVVPEPATLTLVAVGAVGVLALRRRRAR